MMRAITLPHFGHSQDPALKVLGRITLVADRNGTEKTALLKAVQRRQEHQHALAVYMAASSQVDRCVPLRDLQV